VSVVLPVYNGARHLSDVIESILSQDVGRDVEVLVIDDRSTDRSAAIAGNYVGTGRVRLLDGGGRGAAAALNLGIHAARYPIICQLDQDMIPQPFWLKRTLSCLESDPRLAAVQGHFLADPRDGLLTRVSALDLRMRYARLSGSNGDSFRADHVCTGNTLYRAEALWGMDLFDESIGYGYDNDMSYRLGEAGFQLAHCPTAVSIHRRRPGWLAYWREQYGLGYGRLDVIAKQTNRATGDQVSGANMVLHAAGMVAALLLAFVALLLALVGSAWTAPAWGAIGILTILAGERLVTGLLAGRRFRDPAGALFAPVHLVRDLAWAWAVARWTLRWCAGTPRRPQFSMGRALR
jgi:cellulose synthase/poly-beta-1,6-N-acetylglucosamine synthase-like glycosyltransferase